MNKNKINYLKNNLPFFKDLSSEELNNLILISYLKKYSKGELIHSKNSNCTGVILVINGQLRSFLDSSSGKEITMFRLIDRDICLLSASCVFKNLTYDISLEAEKDSLVLIIEGAYLKKLSESNSHVQKFLFDLTQDKLSEVMWIIEQIVFLNFDRRLANFLLNQSYLENSTTLKITHDAIANHLGSAREVVSRMLKRFENEGLIKMSRGTIEIINLEKLK
ncbi:Crp/Fnr family transcriptional regulator [Romboutsia maritimum]|uniref:Crp/Fnr family transcriptional regulator n=1 Tax=Romboutsia maritimum TaxID=2020948 RepID=A0A371IS80_9FIRM|nr:Crp/Fnr family transcriptional regulator [Romboutsia maritimum]